MLKGLIVRGPSTDEGTFGKLSIPTRNKAWYSIELPDRNNEPGKSRINPGIYLAKLKWSNHFQKMIYHLDDKNGRQDVEIHSGNFAGDRDKGYRSDVLGCIMLGLSNGQLPMNSAGRQQRAVLSSGFALMEFQEACDKQDIEVEIT